MSTEFYSDSPNDGAFDNAEDPKKRPFNESDTFDDAEASKRRRLGTNIEVPEGDINVKLLMPTTVAGAVIGKNGETIATVEKETQCQITISKASELFPQTTERVVLITGKFWKVIEVLTFIQEKIRDRRDLHVAADPFDYKYTERTVELKLIIPGSSAGGVIGKGGEYIRSVQDTSGVHVQMSTKDLTAELGTNERVITLSGNEVRELIDGAQMIISKISQDANIHAPNYINTNYNYGQSSSTRARYPSPDRSYNSAADRYSHRVSSAIEFKQSARPFSPHSSAALAPAGNWFGPGAVGGVGNMQVLQFLDGLSQTLRNNGFNEPDVAEIMQSMQTLAKFNVLGLGLGFGLSAISDSSARNGGQAPTFGAMAGEPRRSDMEVGYVSRSGVNRGGSPPPQPYDDRRSKGRASYAESLMKVVRQEPNLIEFSIPDAAAGALLGKQGHRLNEVQRSTGATIDISKRKAGDEGQSQGGRRPDRQLIIEGSPGSIKAARRQLEASLDEEMANRRQNRGR